MGNVRCLLFLLQITVLYSELFLFLPSVARVCVSLMTFYEYCMCGRRQRDITAERKRKKYDNGAEQEKKKKNKKRKEEKGGEIEGEHEEN